MAQWVKNVISTQKDVGLTPGLYQWVKDPAWPQTAKVADVAQTWLWFWQRPAAAAPIWPLAQELKKKEKEKKERNHIASGSQTLGHFKISTVYSQALDVTKILMEKIVVSINFFLSSKFLFHEI